MVHPTPSAPLARHTPAYRRVCLALFLCGFSIFSLLYCVQALLPVFASDFHVSPARSSLALSSSTATVAIAIFFSSSVADTLGRRPVILLSLSAASLLTLLASATRSWTALLVCRALTGVAVGGMPSVLMAYMSEELQPEALGLATGLYIAGSAFGGMAGRLAAGVIADFYSWRPALAALGAESVVGVALCARLLPPSRHFTPRRVPLATLAARYARPLRDRGLPWLFLGGLLLMGSFVTVYNYLSFRLLRPPYSLSQSATSSVFALYIVGMASSTWIGSLASRYGRRRLYWPAIAVMLVGVLLTLARPLPLVVTGVGLVTFGFFGAHSLASSWVGLRGGDSKAQAASLYLSAFYVGSSVIGSAGGLVWSRLGWPGVGAMVAMLLGLALWIGLHMRSVPPLAPQNTPLTAIGG
jgi:YNFM family putative membrane transporter